ncbi:MAG: ABC transporter substrate-binding protein [Candidatus Bipolaricaulota bacterium]|nr:ABC transporter substrate-binding protein [Candidatus Bipolaricaulota bacterium]MDW8126714.1 ABC transporter substrate-binding protein [Candidatus Bipolaricaulota bacterium]
MRKSLAFLVLCGFIGVAQVLNIGIFEDLTTKNIWAQIGPDATVWNTYVLGGQYSPLYLSVPPTWTWLPGLADGFPTPFVEENGSWVATVKVRKGITWSDGTPFTADDVVFTFNVLLTEVGGMRMALALGGNWPSYCPDSLAAVEKIDDYTVKFVYSAEPGLGEWTFGALACPIVQKAYWEPKFLAALETEDPAGSLLAVVPGDDEPIIGGYDLARWEPGAFAQVNKNPAYFATGERLVLYEGGGATIENPRLGYQFTAYGGATGSVLYDLVEGPYVDSIIYPIYLNQDAAVLALQKGEIAMFLNPLGLSKGFEDRLKGTPGVQIIANPPWGFRYLAFNMRREPMNYKAFRVAVATLIDREFVAESVFQGIITPMYSAVPEFNPFWYNPDIVVYGKGLSHAERVAEAVRILKEAGFSWDAEPKVVNAGTRNEMVVGVLPDGTEVPAPKGFKLPDGRYCPELELLAPSAGYDPLRATFAIYIEQWCRELAIPVKANLTGFNVIVNKVWAPEGFEFDMYILGWSLGNPAFPDYLYYFWHSSQDVPDGFNTPGYRNPQYDAVAEAFLKAKSVAEARPLVFKLQEMLAEDVPYVILFDTPIKEAFRVDEIAFPYTEVLGGIQFVWPLTTVKALK